MSKIRQLRTTDLPDLLVLSQQAGWNQTAADWERTLALCGEFAIGVEEQGQVVASTTAIRYAQDLAWIGMVLTHTEHRGQGHARSLMEHTLKHLRLAGIHWAKLDATELGRPIYAKLGFEDECPIERWKRPAGKGPETKRPPLVHDYIVDPSFDRAYFGAYRVPLLNALCKEGAAFVVGYGYAMGRTGAQAAYFGPCVVRTRDAARKLVEWFLSNHPGQELYWDLFPDNSDAVQLAIDYGFEPARHLTRMSLALRSGSAPLLRNNASVFAIAGFEYG
jgi:GNAT superfamily N-acetyltransferase